MGIIDEIKELDPSININGFNEDQLENIYTGLMSGIDVNSILDLPADKMEIFVAAMENGFDMERFHKDASVRELQDVYNAQMVEHGYA